MTPRPRPVSFLWLCSLLIPAFSSPLISHDTNFTDDRGVVDPPSLPERSAHGTGIMVSWLWGLVWGDDSTVTVVDRSPAIYFDARPAAFGPTVDVLGYLIRVEDFSVPCNNDDGEVDHSGEGPWWPGGGSEWEVGDEAEQQRQETEKKAERQWSLEARYGCPRLCVRDKHKPETSETWIALVMRGGCTFVDKVREAQRFGAKGVVVGGENEDQDQHGDGLVQMYSLGDASDITIQSTYITHASYQILSSLIASSNTSTWGLRTVSVGITTDPSGWEWYSPLLTFLILLFLPSSLTLCTLLVHRIRAARVARRERAPEDVVLNLPWRVWEGQETLWELEKSFNGAKAVPGDEDGKQDGKPSLENTTAVTREIVAQSAEGEPDRQCEPSTSRTCCTVTSQLALPEATRKWYETQVECAICLEDFVKGDKVRVLPCRHIFHMDEVDDWLIRRKKLCPICKHDVTRPLNHSSESDLAPSLTFDPQRSISLQHDEPSERTSLSTIYEEEIEPNERTPLLQRPSTSEGS